MKTNPERQPAGESKLVHTGKSVLLFGILAAVSAFVLILAMFLAVSFGAKELTLGTVWTAVFRYDASLTTHQIIHGLRLPRVLAAALVGAAFAVAGALMQGVTRNPLADPGILGVNAGAMLIVAVSFAFYPNLPYSALIVLAFSGAVLSTIVIFLLASNGPGMLTPMRLTVAGAVVAALLHSLTTGIAIYFDLSQDLAYWYAGGVAGVKWFQIKLLAPVILVTIIWALALGRPVSLMALGDEVAANLGVKTKRIRLLAMAAALLLAGTAVSAVGPIGFIGLVIPHIARKLVGTDYRFIIPISALLGAVLLVIADLAARTIDPPKELAIGVMVALVGVPFFLYLARSQRRGT